MHPSRRCQRREHRAEIVAGEVGHHRMRRHAADVRAQPLGEGQPRCLQQRIEHRAVDQRAAIGGDQRVQAFLATGRDMRGIGIRVMPEGGVGRRAASVASVCDLQRAAQLVLVLRVGPSRVLVERLGRERFRRDAPVLAAASIAMRARTTAWRPCVTVITPKRNGMRSWNGHSKRSTSSSRKRGAVMRCSPQARGGSRWRAPRWSARPARSRRVRPPAKPPAGALQRGEHRPEAIVPLPRSPSVALVEMHMRDHAGRHEAFEQGGDALLSPFPAEQVSSMVRSAGIADALDDRAPSATDVHQFVCAGSSGSTQ